MSLAKEFVAWVQAQQRPLAYQPTVEVVGTSVLMGLPAEAQLDLRPPRRRWVVLNTAMLERLWAAEEGVYWWLVQVAWESGFDSREAALASLSSPEAQP